MKKIILSISLVLSSFAFVVAQSHYVSGIDVQARTGGMTSVSAVCDTIFSFPTVDVWTTGLVSDGNYLWNTDHNSGFIRKYSFTGALVTSIPNPGAAFSIYAGGDLEFDGTHLLLLVEELDTVYKIDPLTGTVISRIRIAPCTGNCAGIAFDGTNIWISSYSPDMIYKVNSTTGALINSYPIAPPSALLPIKFVSGGLYGLSIFPGKIHEVDTVVGGIISTQPWCLGYSLGFCKNSGQLWGLSSQMSTGGTQRIYEFGSGTVDVPLIGTENDLFTVFPNPSSGNITISIGNDQENKTLEVYNLLGEKLYTEVISSKKEVSLSDVPSGVYFINVSSARKHHCEKIIVR